MNKIRAFFLNPNVHGILAFIGQVAAWYPSPYSAAIATVAGVLTATTVLLPENGSLHSDDYKEIARNVVAAVSDHLGPKR